MNNLYKEAYEKFYPDLVKSLPMKDPDFCTELEKSNLLFGDLSVEVKAKDTEVKMAAHFLQNTLDHPVKIENNTEPFANLLEVMEKFDDVDCKSLAEEIKIYLSKEQQLATQTNTTTTEPDHNITG